MKLTKFTATCQCRGALGCNLHGNYSSYFTLTLGIQVHKIRVSFIGSSPDKHSNVNGKVTCFNQYHILHLFAMATWDTTANLIRRLNKPLIMAITLDWHSLEQYVVYIHTFFIHLAFPNAFWPCSKSYHLKTFTFVFIPCIIVVMHSVSIFVYIILYAKAGCIFSN